VDNDVEVDLQDLEILGNKAKSYIWTISSGNRTIEQDIDNWIELVFQETSMTWKLVFDAMIELVYFETIIISFDDEFAFESS
jgi:hypothetical protein